MNNYKFNLVITALLVSLNSIAQTPCTDGKAGNYDCNGVDLLSHISAQDLLAEEKDGIWINDIWGWTDPTTDKEYALIGMSNGTSFVDVTDPINPIFLGMLPEHNSISGKEEHEGAKSIWRDIKVYSDHAYIVSEDPSHGMQVFDLTNLRNVVSPPATFEEAGHYDGIGKAHNLVINEDTGYAYAVGANDSGVTCNGGGLHIIDLSNPTAPVYAGCFDDDGYTHDAQCVIYSGPDTAYFGKEICFNSNENSVTIVNVDDKNNPTMISRSVYANSAYTHQGWLTEDHKFFISNDELDELNLGTNTKTFIWNVEDLDNPVLIGTYEHSNKAIDHNLYVVGKYVYESNYTNGLRMMDISDIENGNMIEVGYFDTYISNNSTIFDGTWSNYPFFPSGNIIVSDITNGLFVLRPKDVSIALHPENTENCVGNHIDIPVTVVGENLKFQWQINDGSGFKDIDDFERYKNTTTSIMHAHTLIAEQDGLQFRCIITDEFDQEYISNEMTLTVNDVPIADFEYNIENHVGNVSFTNNSINADSFSWNFGDESDAITTMEPIYKYDATGQYDVTLLATNECGDNSITQTVDLIVTGIENFSPLSEIKIYPVPANNELNIQLNSSTVEFTINMFGTNGQSLLKKTITGNEYTLDISSHKKGIYFINITNEFESGVHKIIIE